MAMETWMRAPIYGSLVLLLSHCGLEQASQSQSVPKNQGKTQVKMGDTLAVSQPTEPPKASENLVAAQPTEPPKVSENLVAAKPESPDLSAVNLRADLVAAKPEEPPKVSEKPDAEADCLRRFSADRFPEVGIGGGIGGGMTCQADFCRNGSLIGNGLTGWTPGIKMCPAGQGLTKLGAAYKRCGIPLPSYLQNMNVSAVLGPCDDRENGYRLGVPTIYSGLETP